MKVLATFHWVFDRRVAFSQLSHIAVRAVRAKRLWGDIGCGCCARVELFLKALLAELSFATASCSSRCSAPVGHGLLFCGVPVAFSLCVEVAEPVVFLGSAQALDLFAMLALLLALSRLCSVSGLLSQMHWYGTNLDLEFCGVLSAHVGVATDYFADLIEGLACIGEEFGRYDILLV
jgi:hypothetical protein